MARFASAFALVAVGVATLAQVDATTGRSLREESSIYTCPKLDRPDEYECGLYHRCRPSASWPYCVERPLLEGECPYFDGPSVAECTAVAGCRPSDFWPHCLPSAST